MIEELMLVFEEGGGLGPSSGERKKVSSALNYTYEKFLDLSLDDRTCLEYLIWFFVLIIPGVQMEDNVLKLLTPAREHGATIIRPRAGLK